ncbi:hypothetical protein SAMN02927924_04371 [Sphingobium faniae]|nr:hypothetical protein SAMN02927924_04371 [Sphingobium faniae]
MIAATDTLGDQIVAAGLAANGFLLDINGALDVPHGFQLPAPWNLPSRLFQFPIEVIRAEQDEPRKIGLRHPLLAAHPFVQHVESVLGIEIAREGVTNRHGYSNRAHSLWHHAVDLISAGEWRELLATQEFTEPRNIFNAVVYGLTYSHHEDKKASGHISTAEARQIMREMGATEPTDRAALLRSFSTPSACQQERGADRWPIHLHGPCAEDKAWSFIIGIEDGWFSYDRSGFLQWSPMGRDRYAAGDSASFTEASGQTAFAF